MALYIGCKAILGHKEVGRHSWLWAYRSFLKEAGQVGTRFVLVTFLATGTKIPHMSNLKEDSFYFCSCLLEIQSSLASREACSALGLPELAVCSLLGSVDEYIREPGLESKVDGHFRVFSQPLIFCRPQSQSLHSLHQQCHSWGPSVQTHKPGRTFHIQNLTRLTGCG